MLRCTKGVRLPLNRSKCYMPQTMRDIFEDIVKHQPLDPMESARQGGRLKLRKRFYEKAEAKAGPEGVQVVLDGKPIRTPARRLLGAPAPALAEAIAAEWQAQGDVIDPAAMPLTRLANAILDGVTDKPAAVAAEIEKYLGSDLLLYRAETPEGLIAAQARHWDPVIEWARATLGARFILAQGVTFVRQPDGAAAAAARAIPSDPWKLGALSSITTLTGSALLSLALDAGRITVDQAWTAAQVDEDWSTATWGRDELALERHALREIEMRAAAKVLALA